MRSKPFAVFEQIPEGLDAGKDIVHSLIQNGMNQLAERAAAEGYTVLWDTLKFEPEVNYLDEGTFCESVTRSNTAQRFEATAVKTTVVEELLSLGVEPAELLARLRKVMEGVDEPQD